MDVREYLDQVRIEASVKAVDMSDVKFNREVYRRHVDQSQEHQARSNMGVRCACLYVGTCVYVHVYICWYMCMCVCLYM